MKTVAYSVPKKNMMSLSNKEIIRRGNEGLAGNDTEKIMQYVADDARWDMPGAFSYQGSEAFRREFSNDAFTGIPTITIKNEIAEGDLVAVEGEVLCTRKDGSLFDASFVDVYRLEDGKIKEMRFYVIEKKPKD